MYHRVCADTEEVTSAYVVQKRVFRKHLQYYAAHYYYTPPLSTLLEGTAVPPAGKRHPLVLTFDDGYLDNYEHALPLLEEFGFSAIIFLVTDTSQGTNWWDVESGIAQAPLMSAAQVREMHKRGIAFGAHSVTHASLPTLNDERLREELVGSKKRVEEILGGEITAFAYPYGDVDERVKSATRAAGYRCAFAGNSGPLRFNRDTMEIRRSVISNRGDAFYMYMKTSGVEKRAFTLYSSLKEFAGKHNAFHGTAQPAAPAQRPDRKKKTLMVFHYLTYPPESGVTKRNFHLMDEALRFCSVRILAFGSLQDEERIRAYVGDRASVTFIPRSAPRWVNILRRLWSLIAGRGAIGLYHTRQGKRILKRWCAEEQWDLVYMSSQTLLYNEIPAGIPVISDTHNVEYEISYRIFRETRHPVYKLYHFLEYILTRREELRLCATATLLLATSERDMGIFRDHLPHVPMRVIPNGVDLEFFAPTPTVPEPRTMVFTGLMNYFPNEQGVHYFLDQVLPLIVKRVPGAKITIVGAFPSKALLRRQSSSVEITGYVTDVRPYIARSEVYVIPLLVGGGTRLKALEAMAMKKPIVSTSIGCEGIHVVDGQSVLFGDTPETFADQVIRLFEDADLRQRLASAAHGLVVGTYGWRSVGKRLEDAFHAAMETPHRRVRP